MAVESEVVDTYADLDTDAIAADIGASLFGKSAEKAELANVDNPLADDIAAAVKPAADKPAVVDPVVDPAKPVVDPAAPAVISGENSEAKPLPKSWKKELAPEWEKASPALKAYVHEREAQVMRGINQYQQGYQAWDNLVKPFQPVLEANPDINPIALMQGLMATHLQLLSPSVALAEKQKMIGSLLTSYGITLDAGTGPAPDAILLDRLSRTENQLNQMLAADKRRQAVIEQEGIASFKKQVDAFSADPKNEFFNEVATDILRFISNGTAADLPSAYELAIWANPAVRAKLLAKQQAENAPTAQKLRKANGQFVNVESDGDTKVVKSKPGSISDTVDAVVAKHYTKH